MAGDGRKDGDGDKAGRGSRDRNGDTGAHADKGGDGAGARCPICGKPTVAHYRPFCSSRCADIDLNRWLVGAYAIPVTAEDDEDGEEPSLAPAPPPPPRRR